MDSSEMPNLDPDPQIVAEIDRRAALVRAEPESFAAMDGLWRAVFGLERWIFIARGSDEAPSPFAAELDRGPVVFAFTTAERARVGGLVNGLSEEDSTRLLAVPLPAAIEWVASLSAVGVSGITFDVPEAGYYAPLENLLRMRDFMAANPPVS